jgi:hypothetical protein
VLKEYFLREYLVGGPDARRGKFRGRVVAAVSVRSVPGRGLSQDGGIPAGVSSSRTMRRADALVTVVA